ncbi:MAG TPA: hypothetical protein VLG49_02725 [Rhabdochlamydiaceae bacterium]|nr:hypothetical protein [Rhabdochlamydiaceae bacterium]
MNENQKKLDDLFSELIALQQAKIMTCAESVIPHITSDDLLQPNDFAELENHPYFRYEEGVLEGLRTARMAILAWQQEKIY